MKTTLVAILGILAILFVTSTAQAANFGLGFQYQGGHHNTGIQVYGGSVPHYGYGYGYHYGYGHYAPPFRPMIVRPYCPRPYYVAPPVYVAPYQPYYVQPPVYYYGY